MDIPPNWNARFPRTVQELLEKQPPQSLSDHHYTSLQKKTENKGLFSKLPPNGYEGVLGIEIPPPSTVSALQSILAGGVKPGSCSICLPLHPGIHFPLWATKYWQTWLAVDTSYKRWSRAISWLEKLEDDEQYKAQVQNISYPYYSLSSLLTRSITAFLNYHGKCQLPQSYSS